MKQNQQIIRSFRERHRILYNLIIIGLIILAMAFTVHFLMQIGTRHGSHCRVPDFSGIQLDRAQRIAQEHDLRLHINDSLFVPAYEGGIVLDQLPQGGVEVKPGRTIYITINSFREKMVPVPYVAGYSLRQAKNILETTGLEIAELIYQPDMATNYVLAEFCKGQPIEEQTKMETEVGSGITLHVGVAPEEGITSVPMLVGLPLKEAKSRLWEAGLNIGEIQFDEGINLLNQKEAKVYQQTPNPRLNATMGSVVSFRLSLDKELIAKEKSAAEKFAEQVLKQLEEEKKAKELEELRELGIHVGQSDSLQVEMPSPEEKESDLDNFF